MKKRYLAGFIESLCFSTHKMAFVSGPRQCGKTTLAKVLLRKRKAGAYYNWDEIEFRRAWAKRPSAILPQAETGAVPLVVLDDIYKDRRWKRNLKGVFDTLATPCDIVVTGSARLSVYMKGSDSLLGRYSRFPLHPFSLHEMASAEGLGPDEAIEALFARSKRRGKHQQARLKSLMAYGPFPEPLLDQDTRKARLWRRNREQLVIREDLRDLSRLPDLSRIEMMAALLPERVGSLFSVAAMREDLEASFDSIKRWMTYLKELYYLFEIKPYRVEAARVR